MSGASARRWPLAVGAVVVAAVALLLWSVARRPGDQQARLIALLGFTATVVLPLVVTALRWLWRQRTGRAPADAAELTQLGERLAEIIQDQWQRAALERHVMGPAPLPVRWQPTTRPVASPLRAVLAGRVLVEPVPGVAAPTEATLWSGGPNLLHALYATVPSGRMIVHGAAGSGKTTCAMLLVLDALRHRRGLDNPARAMAPVPVLVGLAGWRPDRENLDDWVVRQLRSLLLVTDPHLTDRLHELLKRGGLAVVLDGLDELPTAARPTALRTIGEQATYRVVLLCRTDELVAAAATVHLTGAVAVELLPLTGEEVVDHLVGVQVDPVPGAWQALFDAMRAAPDGAVGRALATPLMAGLVRDTYGPSDRPDELLDPTAFPTAAAVEQHLLAAVLRTAYAGGMARSGSRYDLDYATRVLTYLAWRMSGATSRNLAWWEIADWAPRWWRALVVGVATGMLLGGLCGTAVALVLSVPAGLTVGGVMALTSGVVAAVVGSGSGPPRRLHRRRGLRGAGRTAVRELAGALPAGLICGLLFAVLGGSEIGVVLGAAMVLALATAGTVTALVTSPAGVDSMGPADPVTAWRDDRRHSLVIGGLGGVVVGVAFALPLAIGDFVRLGAPAALESGLGFGITLALVGCAMFTLLHRRSAGVLAACCQPRRGSRMPLRVLRFLEDARRRQILRAVGPLYQFRHPRLHDHLTARYEAAHQHRQ